MQGHFGYVEMAPMAMAAAPAAAASGAADAPAGKRIGLDVFIFICFLFSACFLKLCGFILRLRSRRSKRREDCLQRQIGEFRCQIQNQGTSVTFFHLQKTNLRFVYTFLL